MGGVSRVHNDGKTKGAPGGGTTTGSSRNGTAKNTSTTADTAKAKKVDATSTVDSSAAPKRSIEEIKAAARAYALSSTSSSKKRVPAWQKNLPKQSSSTQQTSAPPPSKPQSAPSSSYQMTPGRYTLFDSSHKADSKHPTSISPATKLPANPQMAKAPSIKLPANPQTVPPYPPSAPPYPPHIPPHHLHPQDPRQPPTNYPHQYPPYYPPHYPYYYHPHHPPPPAGGPHVQQQQHQGQSAPPPNLPAPAPESRHVAPIVPAAVTSKPATAPTAAHAAVNLSAAASKATDDQISWTAERLLQDEELDDYDRLIKGLNFLEVDAMLQLFQDDDEDEYHIQEGELGEDEEDDDEDDDDNDNDNEDDGEDNEDPGKNDSKQRGPVTTLAGTKNTKSAKRSLDKSPSDASGAGEENSEASGAALYQELEEELGWLEEEDIEAAVASLLDHSIGKSEDSNGSTDGKDKKSTKASPDSNSAGEKSGDDDTKVSSKGASSSARPHCGNNSVPFKQKVVATTGQQKQLTLVLQKHYQLLVQQAVLTVRAAHYHKYHRSRTDRTEFLAGGETADDLVEILDAAVGMLQDLGQNRKDAIRHHLQFNPFKGSSNRNAQDQRQQTVKPLGNDLATPQTSHTVNDDFPNGKKETRAESPSSERRLTRAQFQRTLVEQSKHEHSAHTVFDIRGLLKLDDTFALIDKSVQHDENNVQPQLLELESNKEACEYVLNATNQSYDKSLVPGSRDISQNFCDPTEFFGPQFKPPCDEKQKSACRRNRNLFTAGEDNLVLRGVNLYGEKQWTLISDRFLPERSTNIVSQRYSKLCVLLYKANGIKISDKGRLQTPPKLESIDDIDEVAISKLKPVPAPAILNVHRWSLEEDLTLLKAVPITGHMWAELGARLIPHRDRGHLRKRYQVLERRVKSTVERSNKRDYIKSVEESAPRPPRSLDDAKKIIAPVQHVETSAPRSGSASSPRRTSSSASNLPTKTDPILPTESTTQTKSPQARPPPQSTIPLPPLPPVHIHPGFPPHTPYIPPGYPPAYPYGYYPYGSPYQYSHPPPYLYGPPPPHGTHDPYSSREAFEKLVRDSSDSSRAAFEKMAQEGPEGSRAAFERMAQDGHSQVPDTSEWSKITDLIQTENMVASAMAVDLARSPPKPAVESNDKEEDKSREASRKSVGLLAGVLERANSKLGESKENKKQVLLSRVLSNKMTTDKVTPPQDEARGTSHRAFKSTTTRDTSERVVFSTDGSPVGLSPGFQRSPENIWPKISIMASSPEMGNLSLASFPARIVGFSPAQQSQADMTPPAHSLDSMALHRLGQSGQSVTSKRKVLFQETLSENDLEAISGLNLMAASPGLPPSGSSESSKKRKDPDKEPDEQRPSLFAKAVGDKNNDRKKRKLVF